MTDNDSTPQKKQNAPKETPAKDAAKVETPVAKAVPVAAKVATFPVKRLIAESLSFFGPEYPAYVAAGGLSGSTSKELSVEDAKSQIDVWLDTEIKE